MANTNLTVRKGQCINFGNCPKADAKEVIEVNMGDEFICPECDGGLIEIQPKRSGFPPAVKWALIIAGIIVALGGGFLVVRSFVFNNTEETVNKLPDIPPVSSLNIDETPASDPVPKNRQQENNQTGDGTTTTVSATPTKTYSFGKYVGSLQNGIPEGDGTMTYTRRVQIAKHDTQNPAHWAEAGDKFVGSWGNGDIVSGALYDRNGVIKERILAPKRFNPYDLSND